jgi:hypothetical protein
LRSWTEAGLRAVVGEIGLRIFWAQGGENFHSHPIGISVKAQKKVVGMAL